MALIAIYDDEISRSLQARFADDLLGKAAVSKLDIANHPMQNWGGSNEADVEVRGSAHRGVRAWDAREGTAVLSKGTQLGVG